METPVPFKKLLVLFIIGCMGTRLLLAYTAKNININYLPIMGYLLTIPAFGFAYVYISGTRKEGAFGQKTWWNDLRPIHALLYGLFAWNAINKKTNSWIYLFIDAMVGLISFIVHHYSNGDIQKLFN